jgi:hypothetical protein
MTDEVNGTAEGYYYCKATGSGRSRDLKDDASKRTFETESTSISSIEIDVVLDEATNPSSLLCLLALFALCAFLLHNQDNFPFEKPNGEGGDAFDAGWLEVGVSQVIVHAGQFIHGIQLKFADGNATDWIGGKTGEAHAFEVRAGDYINNVTVWSGWGVDALQFHTAYNVSSPKYGGDGGDISHQVPSEGMGHQLAGMHGRAGMCLDKVVFVWKPLDTE